MKIINNNLQFYIDKLKNKETFSFTRWGDGEWGCAFGTIGCNVDKHQYFAEMANGLLEALINDKGYIKATWPLTVPMLINIHDTIENFIESNNIQTIWNDARVWEEAAMQNTISPLIKQLQKMNFVIVTGKDKKILPINYTDFIEIPSVDCFLEKEYIKKQMITMCNKYNLPVFGLSASMATNVIADELYEEIGDKCWMIDFGSIWEPYIGKATRSYHHRYKSNKLL